MRPIEPERPPPEVSIVIPVYTEAAILEAAVAGLVERLGNWDPGLCYEILLAENGSRDDTAARAAALAEGSAVVRTFSLGEPNYGKALRRGILEARGEYVICDEIDLCDVDFHARALELLRSGGADLVVGSKSMKGAEDNRPVLRRVATRTINGLLRLFLGFRGTDTHGLKAFRRDALVGTAGRCVVDKDLFASEFVIRAQREGLRVVEIPVRIEEKRRPSIQLARRVPRVMRDLARLFVAIRLGRG
jgi:glycosyltransferase involved in cell wall biosynthesis